MVSVLQSDDQRDKTCREKSENSRKVVSRDMVCFKIIKLVYNNSIYLSYFTIFFLKYLIFHKYFKFLELFESMLINKVILMI